MTNHIIWREPGAPKRSQPLVDQLDELRHGRGRWADIAKYATYGSATSIISRLRRRQGEQQVLEFTTRRLEDGMVHVFARWAPGYKADDE